MTLFSRQLEQTNSSKALCPGQVEFDEVRHSGQGQTKDHK